MAVITAILFPTSVLAQTESDTGLNSFQLQGGLMSDEESNEVRKYPYFVECLNLRQWDDQGKRFDLDSEIPEQVWSDLELCLTINQSIG